MERSNKNVMVLDLETRVKVYYHARDSYISKHPFARAGLCLELVRSVRHVTGKKASYRDLQRLLPEFADVKPFFARIPNKHWWENKYWWKLEDSESRLKAFDRMITIAESKKSSNILSRLLTYLKNILKNFQF